MIGLDVPVAVWPVAEYREQIVYSENSAAAAQAKILDNVWPQLAPLLRAK